MSLDTLLPKLDSGALPSATEAHDAIQEIRMNRAPEAAKAYLIALARAFERPESDPHAIGAVLEGSARALRALAKPFPIRKRPSVLVDSCGTGGDQQESFNVSTAAALIVAGAGIPVAKHGNRAASSRCGSADLLEACGFHLECDPERMADCLEQEEIAFLYARTYHSATAHVASIRKEIPHPTLFNLLGPLSNPAAPTHQLLGLYDDRLVPAMAAAAEQLGFRALIPYGVSMDEIAPDRPTSYVMDGQPGPAPITPEHFGLEPMDRSQVKGADAATNRRILLEILKGQRKSGDPYRGFILMNAAALIAFAQKPRDLKTGLNAEALRTAFRHAQEALHTGAAYAKLRALVKRSGGTWQGDE